MNHIKRHKGLLIILAVLVLARVPIPGKTGEAVSLISRAVLAGYEKTICSNSHSLAEQAARQVALGITCPGDQFQLPLAVLHNIVQGTSEHQKESAKHKSNRAHENKPADSDLKQSNVAGS